ncbi:hypothetical protein [Alkaliphilus metalliredigens]|nr:hypothetical protein [Alkaliphilus metalliredigens]
MKVHHMGLSVLQILIEQNSIKIQQGLAELKVLMGKFHGNSKQRGGGVEMTTTNEAVIKKMQDLYDALFHHDGYAEMRIEIKLMKKGQKEVIIHCGKQYRYVVDYFSKS